MAGKGKGILTIRSPADYEEEEDDSSKLLRRPRTQTASESSSGENQEARDKGKSTLTTRSPAESEEDEEEDDSSRLLRRSRTQPVSISSGEIQEARGKGKSSSSESEEIVEEDGEERARRERRMQEMKRHSGEGSSERRRTRRNLVGREPLFPIKEENETNSEDEMEAREFFEDENGVTKILLKNNGWSAEVCMYGGHVTSWKDRHGEEMLFVSSRKSQSTCCCLSFLNLPSVWFLNKAEAVSNSPKAVFGGIPICFPQFSNFGGLERHGFARKRYWSLDKHPPPVSPNSLAFVDLILHQSGEDANIWPNSFEFRLRVRLSRKGCLRLTSRIKNTNANREPFSFTFAYHTYFFVSDISDVWVEGLETLDYRDSLRGLQRFIEEGDALTFESEVDRAYMKTPCRIEIHDHKKKRTFLLEKDKGLPDAVVSNPWDKKVEDLADFGSFDKNDYKNMLCVGAAYVDRPITLKPGEKWTGRQKLSAIPSS